MRESLKERHALGIYPNARLQSRAEYIGADPANVHLFNQDETAMTRFFKSGVLCIRVNE
jgi:hypothetical protein